MGFNFHYILVALCAFLIFPFTVSGQFYNSGDVFVTSGEELYLGEQVYLFGLEGSTKTSRVSGNSGYIVFGENSDWDDTYGQHFIDGYVKVFKSQPFIYPLGDVHLAPLYLNTVIPDWVHAAYYYSDPTSTGLVKKDIGLKTVSPLEYWHIKSDSSVAIVSLTWRPSSNVSNLTDNELDLLTIVGWNGVNWEIIPSMADVVSFEGIPSSLNEGSITSFLPINLSEYEYYTLGVLEECANLVASSGDLKVWNGGWIPSSPTIFDPVEINSPFNGSLQCNSLVLNSDIVIGDSDVLEVVNDVTGPGKVILANEGVILQRNPDALAPFVQMEKKTRALKRYDYVYFGTPISGNFISQLDDASSSLTNLPNALDLKYKYQSGPGGGWVLLSETIPGSGFIARVGNQAPFTAPDVTDLITIPLNGVANNGEITIPVYRDPMSPNGKKSYNLLANPYPSALDVEKFLRMNTDLDGTIYLWHGANSQNGQYQLTDYAIWNLSGMVNVSPVNETFNGFMASGQGFKIKALNDGQAIFSNCMRTAQDNSHFFRTTTMNVAQDNTEKNRFKINIVNHEDVFSQVLIAYFDEATLGFDRMYDADRNSVNEVQMYTLLDGTSRKLAINARPSFFETDIVSLGIKNSKEEPVLLTMSLEEEEGVFQQLNIILFDKLYGVYHNLSEVGYEFTVSAGYDGDRFEISYLPAPTLGIPNISEDKNVIAYHKDGLLYVIASLEIDVVEIYDLSGRMVENIIAGSKEIREEFTKPQGVYIAHVKFSDGSIKSSKIAVTKQ